MKQQRQGQPSSFSACDLTYLFCSAAFVCVGASLPSPTGAIPATVGAFVGVPIATGREAPFSSLQSKTQTNNYTFIPPFGMPSVMSIAGRDEAPSRHAPIKYVLAKLSAMLSGRRESEHERDKGCCARFVFVYVCSFVFGNACANSQTLLVSVMYDLRVSNPLQGAISNHFPPFLSFSFFSVLIRASMM